MLCEPEKKLGRWFSSQALIRVLIDVDHASKLRLASLAVIDKSCHRKMDTPLMAWSPVWERWSRASRPCRPPHTSPQNSTALSRCWRPVWNSACPASGGYEKSLPRVMHPPVSSARLRLDLPLRLAPARHSQTVLLQGSPARGRCNKGKARTAALWELTVGPRWDAADITADGSRTWPWACLSVALRT